MSSKPAGWRRNWGWVFAGVEISVTLAGHLFHILGYGIDPEGEALQRILAANTALMEEVDHDSIKRLAADGFPIDYGEFCAYDHDPGRGGWKSLSYLIDKGLCTGVGDFFSELFNAKRGIVFPEFPHPAAAIAAIKEAGGVPVLAHPGSEFHGPALEETMDMFAAQDIEGVECFHPATTRRRRSGRWSGATATACLLPAARTATAVSFPPAAWGCRRSPSDSCGWENCWKTWLAEGRQMNGKCGNS
jgi:predicted metal-dependent phosphoesterase TrpH